MSSVYIDHPPPPRAGFLFNPLLSICSIKLQMSAFEMAETFSDDGPTEKLILELRLLTTFIYLLLCYRVISGKETKHIQYIVYEYEDLIDSSNMSTKKMLQIALDVQVCTPYNKENSQK